MSTENGEPLLPPASETGPWQRIEDVPEGVWVSGNDRDRQWRGAAHWKGRSERAGFTADINSRFAPFVVAEVPL